MSIDRAAAASPSRVAIVTGGSSGLGRALADRLSASGWRVGLVARRQETLEAFAHDLNARGGVAEFYPADVGSATEVNAAVEFLTEKLGPVELAIASAGLAPEQADYPIDVAEVERIVRVNYLGVVHLLAAVLPGMIERRRGHVAAISSLASFRGTPGLAPYSASKAAVNRYLESMRLDLAGKGVAVTTLCPGYTKTAMTAHNQGKMPQLMDVDDAVRRMLYALQRRRTFYAFPWPLTLVVRLSQIAPDWVVKRFTPRHLPGPRPPE